MADPPFVDARFAQRSEIRGLGGSRIQLGRRLALEEKLVAVVELFGRNVRVAVGVDVTPDLGPNRRRNRAKAEERNKGRSQPTPFRHAVILPYDPCRAPGLE